MWDPIARIGGPESGRYHYNYAGLYRWHRGPNFRSFLFGTKEGLHSKEWRPRIGKADLYFAQCFLRTDRFPKQDLPLSKKEGSFSLEQGPRIRQVSVYLRRVVQIGQVCQF